MKDLIVGPHTRVLYVPDAFNFAEIDTAAIWLDRNERKAHVYLIQVTISKSHKDSEAKF
jgi:hypothetical protein